MNIAGVAEPKQRHKCSKCGALGHHASGCTRFGFAAGKLGPIEAQQTAVVEAGLAKQVQQEAFLRQQEAFSTELDEQTTGDVEGAKGEATRKQHATPEQPIATQTARAEEVGSCTHAPLHCCASAPLCCCINGIALVQEVGNLVDNDIACISSSEGEEDHAPRPTRSERFASAAIAEPTHDGNEPLVWARRPTSTTAERQMVREAMHGPGDANIATTWNPCTRADVAVARSDLRSLRVGEWLTGQAIESYLHLAVDLHRTFNELPRVRILKNINAAHKLREGPHAMHGWFKRDKELFQWDRILIPSNTSRDTGSHWYLVVLDIENRQVVSYDSLDSPCADGLMRIILEWVQAELESSWKKAQPSSKVLLQTGVLSWPRVTCKGLRQFDGHSCGVYCCQAALLVALGEDPATCGMSDADIPALRERMAVSLLSGRIQV